MTDDATTARPPHAATTLDELGSGPGFRKVRDDPVVVGPGGVVRVDAQVVRRLVNASDAECTIIALGTKDGNVGRDGQLTEAELAKLADD